MKTFVTAALLGALTSAEELLITSEFMAFMNYVGKYNKTYASVEDFQFRFEQFLRTHAFIEEINTSDSSTHVAGHNKFSDWTEEEFKSLMGLQTGNTQMLGDVQVKAPEVVGDIPESWDWREEGKVSIVKDQGSCGSCWAFSTTGAIESAYAINFGSSTMDMTLFSEQQLVDCAGGEFLNGGCNGGWYYWAYQYLRHAAFLETEEDYPYTAHDDTCVYDADKGVVGVSAYSLVTDLGTGGTRDAIASAIYTTPSNVAVAAGNQYFQTYTSGVLSSTSCPIVIDHAILAVGYGKTSEGDYYYIVKNSWGTSWGESGYINILATPDGAGICGVNQYVTWPEVFQKP